MISLPLPPVAPLPKQPRATSPVSFFGYSVFKVFLLALLLLTLPTLVRGNLQTCVTTYDPAVDYFPDKVIATHAEDFSVTYFKNYKLVNNERTGEVFVLYQCGTPAPTGLNATYKFFSVPLQSVAITTTVDIPFIETLGARTKIKLVQGPEYVSSACMQTLIINEEVTSLSYNKTIRNQQLEDGDVDAIFVFSSEPSYAKAISVSTSLDPGSLHRAEWMDFLSTFFNQEAISNVYYANVTSRYECASTLAKGSTSTQPKVAWVDFRSYESSRKWAISNKSYKLEFITDLGAIPVHYEVEGFTSAAEWQAKMAGVDIVIDETYNGDMADFYANFNLSSTSNFPFIKNGQIWRFDKLQSALGALDWFEGAMISPDGVLEDLLTFVKPAVAFPRTPVWFRNSFTNQPIVVEDAAKCPDPTVLPLPRASDCQIIEDSDAAFLRPAALVTVLLATLLAFILA